MSFDVGHVGVLGNLGGGGFSDLSDLKAYYKFDEASGNIINKASDVGSVAEIANSDLVVTGATYGSTGIIGDALSFDGTNDIAQASSSAVADWSFINKTGAEWSIIMWYKFNTPTGSQQLFATTNINVVDTGILVRTSEATRKFKIFLGKYTTDLISHTTTLTTPNDTNFHMLYMSYSDSAGDLKISIDDGSVETLGSQNLTNTSNPETYFTLASNTAFGFGEIITDETSLWGRILSASEITDLYNGGSGLEL